MKGITKRFSLAIVLLAVGAVSAGEPTSDFSIGQLVIDTGGGAAVAVLVGGEDVTGGCEAPFCNGNPQTGTDGQTYNVILGYSPGPLGNQWLNFNIFGTEGPAVVNGVVADAANCDGCSTRILGLVGSDWTIIYGPGTGLPQASGSVVSLGSDPSSFPNAPFVGVVTSISP